MIFQSTNILLTQSIRNIYMISVDICNIDITYVSVIETTKQR